MDSITAKKRFCSDKCRIYFSRELKKQLEENNLPNNRAKILNERNKVLGKPKKELLPFAENDCFIPKNLNELKELCPKEYTGFEKSEWIANNRQKYNI